jgi:hypothetical protein
MSESYLELERNLRPLADPLPPPRPGDWAGVTWQERSSPAPGTVLNSTSKPEKCWYHQPGQECGAFP